MRIADRDIRRLLLAPFALRHWRALRGIVRTFDDPRAALIRYLTNGGQYPWLPTVRTPLGPIQVILADRHDLLTVNEIFCRQDYGASRNRTVVDIGANVGFATLFFLTRSPETRVWAFEPDPENIVRLRKTLSGFEDRYTLFAAAVTADDLSRVRFVTAGRYGHIAGVGEPATEVPAVSIARALRGVSDEAGPIDLVKIDTEGTESELLAGIPPDVLIKEIRYEDGAGRVVSVRRRPA